MVVKEYNETIRKNLLKYMQLHDKTQTDIAKYLGTNVSTVSSWCSGARSPKMSSIDKLCELFKVKRSDFIGNGIDDKDNKYSKALEENTDLQLLLEVAMKSRKEDIHLAYELLLSLLKR